MTEIKSGADLTASSKLLQQMRQAVRDGSVDNKELVDLTKTASNDAGGLTDSEKDLINSIRTKGGDVSGLSEEEQNTLKSLGTSKTSSDVVSKNIESIKNLGSYEGEANAVNFSNLNLVTESSSLVNRASFGLFGGTNQLSHVVRISDSDVPSNENPTNTTSMQDRQDLEKQNLATMLGPLEQELRSNSPAMRERVAQMLSQDGAAVTPDSPEVDAKIASLLEQVTSYGDGSGTEVYSFSQDIRGLLNSYSQSPPPADSKMTGAYMSALRGALYNASDSQRLAGNEAENIGNANFQLPGTVADINKTASQDDAIAKSHIRQVVTNSEQLLAQLEELQKKDPKAFQELTKGKTENDLNFLREQVFALKQHLNSGTPTTQAQMSQVNMVWGSLEQMGAELGEPPAPQENAQRSTLLGEKAKLEGEIQVAQGLLATPETPENQQQRAAAQTTLDTNRARLTQIDQELAATPATAASPYSESTQQLINNIRQSHSTTFEHLKTNYFEIENAVDNQSAGVAELAHAENTLQNILVNRPDLNESQRTQLKDQLAAVQAAKKNLEQGQPVNLTDAQTASLQKVLDGMQAQRAQNGHTQATPTTAETSTVDASCEVDRAAEACVVSPTATGDADPAPVVATSPSATAGVINLDMPDFQIGVTRSALLRPQTRTFLNPTSGQFGAGSYGFTLDPSIAALRPPAFSAASASSVADISTLNLNLGGVTSGVTAGSASSSLLDWNYGFGAGASDPWMLDFMNYDFGTGSSPASTPASTPASADAASQQPKDLSSIFLDNVGAAPQGPAASTGAPTGTTAGTPTGPAPATGTTATDANLPPEQQQMLTTLQEIRNNTHNNDLKIRLDDAMNAIRNPQSAPPSTITASDRQAFMDTLGAYQHIKTQRGPEQAQHFIDMSFQALQSNQTNIESLGATSRSISSNSPEALAQLDASFSARAVQAPVPATSEVSDVTFERDITQAKNAINRSPALMALATQHGMPAGGNVYDFIRTTTNREAIRAFADYRTTLLGSTAGVSPRDQAANRSEASAIERILHARGNTERRVGLIDQAKATLIEQRRIAAENGVPEAILGRIDAEVGQLDSLRSRVLTRGYGLPSEHQTLLRAQYVQSAANYLTGLAGTNESPVFTERLAEFERITEGDFSAGAVHAFELKIRDDVTRGTLNQPGPASAARPGVDPTAFVTAVVEADIEERENVIAAGDSARTATDLRDPNGVIAQFQAHGPDMPGLSAALTDAHNPLTIFLNNPDNVAALPAEWRSQIEGMLHQTRPARTVAEITPDQIRTAALDMHAVGGASLDGNRSVERASVQSLQHINSLTGSDRTTAVSQAEDVDTGIRSTIERFTQQLEQETEQYRSFNNEQRTEENQIQNSLANEITRQHEETAAKSAEAVAAADKLAEELILAPLPETGGEQHLNQLISDFLNIIRDLDMKTRQLVMARLAAQMMNNAITAFYKDKMDQSNKYHQNALDALANNFKDQIDRTLSVSTASQSQNSQAAAAMSGQVTGSSLSIGINQGSIRENVGQMLDVTSKMNPPLAPAQRNQLLQGVNRILEAAGTAALADDSLAIAQMNQPLVRDQVYR